jgi:hypothetical protein
VSAFSRFANRAQTLFGRPHLTHERAAFAASFRYTKERLSLTISAAILHQGLSGPWCASGLGMDLLASSSKQLPTLNFAAPAASDS